MSRVCSLYLSYFSLSLLYVSSEISPIASRSSSFARIVALSIVGAAAAGFLASAFGLAPCSVRNEDASLTSEKYHLPPMSVSSRPSSASFFSPVASAAASHVHSLSFSSAAGIPYGSRPMAVWYFLFVHSTRRASASLAEPCGPFVYISICTLCKFRLGLGSSVVSKVCLIIVRHGRHGSLAR